ncbi:hypothetical protein Tco_0047857 [Tanacetum coccineum]
MQYHLPQDQVHLPDTKAQRSPNQLHLNLSQFLRKTVILNKLKDNDMQKNLATPCKDFTKLYKPYQQQPSNFFKTRNKTKDTTPSYNNDNPVKQFGNQRTMTVVGARETVGSQVVQQNEIQCFNSKGFGSPKWVKYYMYHKEKMMMCKQAEQCVPLQAEQADWLEDTDEEIDEHELEAHYSFMAKI